MSSVNDYFLRVRAGPDKANLTTISVNDESNPIVIDNDYFTGYLVVRVLDFHGVTPQMETADNDSGVAVTQQALKNPASNYFKGKNRRYSIMVQGSFKNQWNGNDIIFGADSDVPVINIQ